MKKTVKKLLISLCVAVLWIGIWEIASCNTSNLILPSPAAVFSAFCKLASEKEFYLIAFFSLERIMAGFLLGVLLGCVCGGLSALAAPFDYILAPMRSIIKATPVSSFILLLWFWFSRETVPLSISMLIVFPVVYSAVYEGIKSCDPLVLEMADIYNVPLKKRIFMIYGESVKSRLVAAATTSLGLAWKAGVAAEVLTRPQNSIGNMLYQSKQYLETENLLAWTALVIILSVILEKLIKLVLWLFNKERVYDKA